MKKLIIFLILAFLGFTSKSAFSGTHTITQSMVTANPLITPSSWSPSAQPGDTIIIAADVTSNFRLHNFDGTPNKKYTFTNPPNAKVTVSTWDYVWYGTGIRITASDNFILSGDNYESEQYGIYLDGGGQGLRLFQCADWEISHIEIRDGGISQNNNDAPGTAWTEANSIGDCHLHHCFIHDCKGESVYLGKSKIGDHPQWNTLEIDHLTVINSGLDGIQAGQIDSGGLLKVHANFVENVGTRNEKNQNSGITTSAEAENVEVYNNIVENVSGLGLYFASSYSGDGVHDNLFINCGHAGSKPGINVTYTGANCVLNNTVVSSGKEGIKASGTGTVKYNFVVNSGATDIMANSATKAHNVTSASIEAAHFRDADNHDYSLTVSSPAVNVSLSGKYSPRDINGITRPYAESFADAGAYELASGSPPLPPESPRIEIK